MFSVCRENVVGAAKILNLLSQIFAVIHNVIRSQLLAPFNGFSAWGWCNYAKRSSCFCKLDHHRTDSACPSNHQKITRSIFGDTHVIKECFPCSDCGKWNGGRFRESQRCRFLSDNTVIYRLIFCVWTWACEITSVINLIARDKTRHIFPYGLDDTCRIPTKNFRILLNSCTRAYLDIHGVDRDSFHSNQEILGARNRDGHFSLNERFWIRNW